MSFIEIIKHVTSKPYINDKSANTYFTQSLPKVSRVSLTEAKVSHTKTGVIELFKIVYLSLVIVLLLQQKRSKEEKLKVVRKEKREVDPF